MSPLEKKRSHSRIAVVLCLVVTSALAISAYPVPPVFSQPYVTVTRFLTYTAIGFQTVTSFLTYVIMEHGNPASTLTYTTVLFTTTTSNLTYVTARFTTSTTFFTQPAPDNDLIPISQLSMDYLSTLFYAFLVAWVGFRARAFHAKTKCVARRNRAV
jgi:hypothetical protein